MAKLQHIVTDLHQLYLTEMEAQIKPKLTSQVSSNKFSGSGSGSDSDGDPTKKQARQLVYDTRYKARREGIPLERAFSQTIQNSKASAPVKDAAKALLFSAAGVKEETDIQEKKDNKQKVLVTPVKGYGKPYRRYADTIKIDKLRKNPQIQSVTPTAYGDAYEGERTRGVQTTAALQHKSTDYDKDGKIENSSKEHAGVVHNAIQKATGKIPDGKDTRKNKVKINKESFKSFCDWRKDLCEVISPDKDIKFKKKTGDVNNKINIHPNLDEDDQALLAKQKNTEQLQTINSKNKLDAILAKRKKINNV